MGEKIVGESTHRGFRISDVENKEIIVRSEYYTEEDSRENPVVRLARNKVTFDRALLFFSLSMLSISANMFTGNRVIVFIISFLLMFMGLSKFYKARKFQIGIGEDLRQASQWHSAEHKIIGLLESGKELTLENLKAADEKTKFCGIGNYFLEEPDDAKLNEALKVGKEYLRLKGL